MMGCGKARRFLRADFAGELTLEERLGLEAHLEACADCKGRAREQGMVLERLRAFRDSGGVERVDLDRFVEGVFAQVDGDGPVQEREDRPVLRFAGLLAAGLALALGAWWYMGSHGAAPERESSDFVAKGVEGETAPELALAEQTREWVMGRLREVLQEAPIGDAYGELVGELREAGWPLEPILARLAQEGAPRVAENAIAALGLEGTRVAEFELWRLRDESELADLAAVQWLGVVFPGEGGRLQGSEVRKLEELFWREPLRDSVVAFGRRLGPKQALALAVDWARGARPGDWDADAVAGIGELMRSAGPAGTRSALDELKRGGIPRELWVAEVVLMEGVRDQGQNWVNQDVGRGDRGAALELMAAMPDRGWVPRLVEWAEDRRIGPRSMEVLANQPGLGALQGLLALKDRATTQGEGWLEAWRRAATSDPARVEQLGRKLWGEQQGAYGKALLLCETEAVAPGMLALLEKGGLSEGLALQLLEALAGSGAPGYGKPLADLILQWPPMRKAEASACLLALGRLGGEEMLREVLMERYGMRPGKRLGDIVELALGGGEKEWDESLYLMERRLPQARRSRRGLANGISDTVE